MVSGGSPTPPIDYSKRYVTFTALETGTFTFTGTVNNSINYSLDDGETWTALAKGVASPTVNAGSKIMWKGTCSAGSSSTGYGIGAFSSTGAFDVEGNIMSLIRGDSFIDNVDLTGKARCFTNLFNGCTTIVNAKNLVLPATTLVTYSYSSMFYGCTSLVTAPENLPATALTNSCYYRMFRGCSALTTSPVLPATTLTTYCYRDMFSGCSSLDYIKCLATDISASSCTNNWVSSVKATGTFVKAASMSSWTTGNSGIPSGWTVQDA